MKYLREYMNYKDSRITYDSNINFYFNYCYYYNCSENVIEIKISKYMSINIIGTIIPNKILRFSKYCKEFFIKKNK